MRHEWDWPPPQRARREPPPTLEARIVRERVQFVRPPLGPRIARAFAAFIVCTVKALVGAVLGVMIVAALWLLWTIA